MKLAFIGLGAMGFPMAGHLVNNGFETVVFNRSAKKALKWQEHYRGKIAETPAKACENADVILICVGNDDDVRSVFYGVNGVLGSLKEGAIVVDHTTTSSELANELHIQCKNKSADFLDGPVSGGQAGAENAKLTVMLGGEHSIYDKVRPVLDCYAQKHALLGPVGFGQKTKMVNQICIAGVVQGLSEAIHFAMQAGLDVEKTIDVISKGAAQSWQMENRAMTMANNQFDFGFAVDWMRKDLDIVLTEAKRNQSHLPLTALVDQFYSQVQSNGGGRFDTSSLITLLNK